MERAKNLTEEELQEMMDKETFLTPEQCLEYGFCDEISSSKVDPSQLNQQAEVTIRQLRQQINSFQSFHKEMEQFVPKEKPPVPEKKEKGDKVLKMMGAFLNAFERSSK